MIFSRIAAFRLLLAEHSDGEWSVHFGYGHSNGVRRWDFGWLWDLPLQTSKFADRWRGFIINTGHGAAAVISLNLAFMDLLTDTMPVVTVTRFWLCRLWRLSIVVMIVIGICIPAQRQVMRIQPAEALHENKAYPVGEHSRVHLRAECSLSDTLFRT